MQKIKDYIFLQNSWFKMIKKLLLIVFLSFLNDICAFDVNLSKGSQKLLAFLQKGKSSKNDSKHLDNLKFLRIRLEEYEDPICRYFRIYLASSGNPLSKDAQKLVDFVKPISLEKLKKIIDHK